MPTEVGAFVILVALIPGWWFIRKRERVTGDQRVSSLDELLQVLVAGIATTGVPLAALLLLPEPDTRYIVDVRKWMSQGDTYVEQNLSQFVLTGVLVLVTAIGLAEVSARFWPSPRPMLNDRSSMWVNTIGVEKNPGHKYISAELQDGRVVEGYLFGITPDGPVDEQVLTLEKPISMKSTSADDAVPYPVDRIAIPLSQLKYVSVVTIAIENRCRELMKIKMDRNLGKLRFHASMVLEKES